MANHQPVYTSIRATKNCGVGFREDGLWKTITTTWSHWSRRVQRLFPHVCISSVQQSMSGLMWAILTIFCLLCSANAIMKYSYEKTNLINTQALRGIFSYHCVLVFCTKMPASSFDFATFGEGIGLSRPSSICTQVCLARYLRDWQLLLIKPPLRGWQGGILPEH